MNGSDGYLSIAEEQQAELEVMKELHAFCVKHGLRYILAYGTLLGAIRHKGFIPWDNDMDVIITGYQIEKASVNADYSKSQKTLTITRTLDSNKDNCENAFAYLSSQKQLIKGLKRVSEKSIQGSSSSSHYDASVKFNLLFSDSKLTATFTGINNIEEGVTWATKIAQDIFDYIDSVD